MKSALDIYQKELAKTKPLSREWECALARKAQAGDRKARDALVRANLRFCVSIARQYARQGVHFDDLVQAGNIGLLRAVDRFNPDRGMKFISYAVWWVRQSILAHISEQSRVVRVPHCRNILIGKIDKAKQKLEQEKQRPPTPDELAKAVGVPVNDILLMRMVANNPFSLDAPTYVNGERSDIPFGETLRGGYDADTNAIERDDIDTCLAILEAIDGNQKIAYMQHYGLDGGEPQLMSQVGKNIGRSKERVRQMLLGGLQKLKDAAINGGYEFCPN